METLLIALTALIASCLTLFSGFGLGTLLMPVFALFFPVPVAVAATAVIHLANNGFKLALLGRHADRRVVLRFGIPAMIAAFGGAAMLGTVAGLATWYRYDLGGTIHEVTPVKSVIGLVIVIFAILELWPQARQVAIPERYLPLGGLLSGFFGGLSGNQGAFRSAFLIKLGLSKEAFVATGVVSAVLVDLARISIYGRSFLAEPLPRELLPTLGFAMLAAFLGAYVGKRLLTKVTLPQVQRIVAAGLVLLGMALATGLI